MSLPDSDSVSIMEEKFDEKKALKEKKASQKKQKKYSKLKKVNILIKY